MDMEYWSEFILLCAKNETTLNSTTQHILLLVFILPLHSTTSIIQKHLP